MKNKPAPVSNVRSFFSEELRNLMDRRRFEAKEGSFEYVVELLVRTVDSESLFTRGSDGKITQPTLFELYNQYLQGDSQTKVVTLQRLGDLCMVVTGLFPDSLKHKLVDLDYYFGMGGSAYGQLSHTAFHELSRNIFLELSQKFKEFADLLSEMSERSGLQSNGDLLRLYEKWLLTGSDRLRVLLKEKGILSTIPLDPKIRH